MTGAAALAAEIAEGHGGLDRWAAIEAMTVDFTSGGMAFTTKGQRRALRDVTGRFRTGSQAVHVSGQWPQAWEYRCAGARELAADLAGLRVLRSRFRWTASQVGAFAAAAMWTYVSVPFLLSAPDVGLEVLSPRHGLRRLRVRFPGRVATHCPEQVLHIGVDGLIRRHDYTALAFGRWARAAQTLDRYRSFEGVLVATDRRVTPRLFGRQAPGPTLVWIQINQVRPETGSDIRPM